MEFILCFLGGFLGSYLAYYLHRQTEEPTTQTITQTPPPAVNGVPQGEQVTNVTYGYLQPRWFYGPRRGE